MSASPLKKFILTPVIISASVFAALTLPLVFLGNKPVTIKLQQDPVFYGPLRDIATPYVGLVSALSLGAGAASVAIAGWQQSRRKSEEVEAQLSGLEQHLKEKEAQLEAIKLSESRLEASGLKAFLDEDALLEPTKPIPVATSSVPPVVEESVIAPQPLEAQVVASPTTTVQTAAAKFASAQTFLGYAQGKASKKPATSASEVTHKEVEQLNAQMQQLMAQMASMQAALEATSQAVKPGTGTQVPANEASQQVAQSWSVHQMAS
jgi:chaperonin cofactor prefoldin